MNLFVNLRILFLLVWQVTVVAEFKFTDNICNFLDTTYVILASGDGHKIQAFKRNNDVTSVTMVLKFKNKHNCVFLLLMRKHL